MIITASAPRRPNRNRRILIALGLWLGLAVVFFAWAGVQNAGYRSQFTAYISGVRADLDETPLRMKQAQESGDVGAVVAVLNDFSATLSQKASQPPVLPGVQIGIDAEIRKQAALVAATKGAADVLKQTADYVTFQSQFARNLQALGLKDAGNYEHIIGLADAWKDTANTLQHAEKPRQITEVSTVLLQKMTVAESRIRELAELHKQGDVNGFTVKQKELATIIDEIKPLGARIAEISASLDTELLRALAGLRQNL